jgi:hypothetical protein
VSARFATCNPEAHGMSSPELRKQISIFVPLSDWKAIRLEAARLRIPMTELCRRWMKTDLDQLKRQSASKTSADFADFTD